MIIGCREKVGRCGKPVVDEAFGTCAEHAPYARYAATETIKTHDELATLRGQLADAREALAATTRERDEAQRREREARAEQETLARAANLACTQRDAERRRTAHAEKERDRLLDPIIRAKMVEPPPPLIIESATLLARADAAERALRELVGQIDRQRVELMPDWACAECRPESDMLTEGFRCGLHAARAALAPATNRPGSNDARRRTEATVSDETWTGTWCPQCGPDVSSDEDGCCELCGATCVGCGVERALGLRARIAALEAERAAYRAAVLEEAASVVAYRADADAIRALARDAKGGA